MITESSWDTASVWQAEDETNEVDFEKNVKCHVNRVFIFLAYLKLTHLHCIFDRGLNRFAQEQFDCKSKAPINMSLFTYCSWFCYFF